MTQQKSLTAMGWYLWYGQLHVTKRKRRGQARGSDKLSSWRCDRISLHSCQSNFPLLSDVNYTSNFFPVYKNPLRQCDWIAELWLECKWEDRRPGSLCCILISHRDTRMCRWGYLDYVCVIKLLNWSWVEKQLKDWRENIVGGVGRIVIESLKKEQNIFVLIRQPFINGKGFPRSTVRSIGVLDCRVLF